MLRISIHIGLGSSLCLLCTAATHRAPRAASEQPCPPTSAPQQPSASPASRVAYAVRIWLLVVGGALCVVSVVAALLIGLTWDNAPGAEDDDTPDDAVVLGMLGALLTLVVGLQLVAARLQEPGDQLVLTSAAGNQL